ncbi:MAG: hypothetical protein ACYTKD_11580 [Planctomycetota bacterium]|jgi:hypothetical protein
MKRGTKLKLGVGALGLVVGPFLTVIAGDSVALVAFPQWDLQVPTAGEVSWVLALYLTGCVASVLAVVIALVKTREAIWGWVAGSIAAVLFLVPVSLVLAGGRTGGRIVFGVWAIVFAELVVAWAVAFAGRWVFLRLALAAPEAE